MNFHAWIHTIHQKSVRALVSIAAVVVLLAIGAYVFTLPHPEPALAMSEEYIAAVGPSRAQEVALEHAQKGDMAVNGHMFFHIVGAYLYKTYGVPGISQCKPYFDHGCYNGFMMSITSINTTQDAIAACNAINDYTLNGCIHGAGHTALMLSNNDVPQALRLCSTFSAPYATTTLTACTFGVFMANAEPQAMGGMDMTDDMDMPGMDMSKASDARETWALTTKDSSFPCDDPRIEEQYRSGCWRMQIIMLTNRMAPEKALPYCNALTSTYPKDRCYYGFADAITRPTISTDTIISLCNSVSKGWKDTCLLYFVQRAYLNGFDSRIPDAICKYMDTGSKTSCTLMRTKMESTLSALS